MAMFMIRYGEIALKSPRIRRRFEGMLSSNIASWFVDAGRECRLERERGRIFLWSGDEAFAASALSRTFGIVSFSRVEETGSEQADIFELAVRLAKPHFKKGTRFCVRARRSGQHRYTSMELARDAGSAVFLANEHLAPKVDLTNPELEVFIEVRQSRAYVYTGSSPGPGGMPLGSQGRVLGIVENMGGAAACWLMMKRGCRVVVAAADVAMVEPLKSWDPSLKVVGLDADVDIPGLAKRNRAEGVCLGWGVPGIERRGPETLGWGMPAFYPLAGMTNGEVEQLLKRIEGN
jgi:thiamine biosynthesis protein ThiI